MGCTIQFESHKNELARIRELEYAPEVLEYYDQPPAIKLTYRSLKGRQLGIWHTPDFFVLCEAAAGWEECKTEAELIRLAEQSPHRYQRTPSGSWHCPPGQAYAAQFGFSYNLRSSAQINWTWQRNMEFLADYLRDDAPLPPPAALTAARSCLANAGRLSLVELLHRAKGLVTRDDLYVMLANGDLYVDLHAAPLTEGTQTYIYAEQLTASTYRATPDGLETQTRLAPIFTLATGTLMEWDLRHWTVANVGVTMVSLVGENQEFTELPRAGFERLVRERRITLLTPGLGTEVHSALQQRLAAADTAAYAEANRRAGAVQAYLNGTPPPASCQVPARTLSRWVKRYRAAQVAWGNGFAGLLPLPRSGNTRERLPAATQELLTEFIAHDYETLKQKRQYAVYAAFVAACAAHDIPPTSYKTFCQALRQRPRAQQIRQRQGPRAAYQHQPWHWELSLTTPRHGERPLQIAHLDHTELDVALLCSLTGQPLGRPWATFLMDAYTRRLLAVYLTFDPPSYRSCMMALRECVRRHGRLPQTLVVDGGREFSSVYFETLLARYECTKKHRPPAQSRFGSVCERLFGTANTQFVHNLQGNTQLLRNVRQATPAVQPQRQAVWTLDKLHLYLCDWAYESYDLREHPALGQSPRQAFCTGLAQSGTRAHRLIPYDEQFRLFTLPTTRRGTAKVVPGCGVKINYIYYWAEAFRAPEVEGTRLAVRFDPYDVGVAYAFVAHQWVTCYSQFYSIFHQCSERELLLASAELRRRQGQHAAHFTLTATQLAQFLASVEAEEVLLRQRLADRAARQVQQLSEAALGVLSPAPHPSAAPPDQAALPVRADTPDVRLETYGEFR
jgi:transposase InsO family protein